MTMTTEKMMSPADLQELLGVKRSKSYDLLRSGQIRSYRVGRLLRVRRSDAEAWLERNRYRPNENTPDEQER